MSLTGAVKATTITVLAVAGCAGGPRLTLGDTEERDGVRYALGSVRPFTGTLVTRADSGDVILVEEQYRDGTLHGRRRERYPSGRLRREETFRRGRSEGQLREWAESGHLILEAPMQAGERHGVVLTWYPAGQQASQADYVRGQLHGRLMRWHENGQLQYDGSYANGYADGPSTEWHVSGARRREAFWRGGRPDSTFTTWYENGRPQMQGRYGDGMLLELQRWDEVGNLLPDSGPSPAEVPGPRSRTLR